MQGEMINESGTMTGGGGRPRAGRMCLGSAAPRRTDDKASAAELAAAEKELAVTQKVRPKPRNVVILWTYTNNCGRNGGNWNFVACIHLMCDVRSILDLLTVRAHLLALSLAHISD